MTYQGWTNWDTWEMWLTLESDEKTYRWLLNWNKTFDKNKAKLVVVKYLTPVARGKERAGIKIAGDPDINPKEVNAKEIIDNIINMSEGN